MVLKGEKICIDRLKDIKGDFLIGLFSIDLPVHFCIILVCQTLQKYINRGPMATIARAL